jgi:hypothetical protein
MITDSAPAGTNPAAICGSAPSGGSAMFRSGVIGVRSVTPAVRGMHLGTPTSTRHWSPPHLLRSTSQEPVLRGKLFDGQGNFLEPRPATTIHIELRPDEEQAFIERARVSGHELADYIHQVLEEHLRVSGKPTCRDRTAAGATLILEDLIDDEAIASCAVEADDRISLEAVRAATSRIKDSMVRVVIEDERAERF